MRKKLCAMGFVTLLGFSVLTGCGNSKSEDASSTTTQEKSDEKSSEEDVKSSAVAMTRTSNPTMFVLNNAEGVFDEKKESSWVKIATIWDPELTPYDAESFTQGSKAIAATFDVSGLDISDMTCYWNYMVADSAGAEYECWDTSYTTDDLKITEDGKYQMVFDFSKLETADVAEIKSLQIVFPGTSQATTMKVDVKDAVCITDESEIGTVYKTGKVE